MENLGDLWASLPAEIQLAVGAIAIWVVDWLVTKTKNPFDNMLWRWYKGKKIAG